MLHYAPPSLSLSLDCLFSPRSLARAVPYSPVSASVPLPAQRGQPELAVLVSRPGRHAPRRPARPPLASLLHAAGGAGAELQRAQTLRERKRRPLVFFLFLFFFATAAPRFRCVTGERYLDGGRIREERSPHASVGSFCGWCFGGCCFLCFFQCARVMGFPDSFQWPNAHSADGRGRFYKQVRRSARQRRETGSEGSSVRVCVLCVDERPLSYPQKMHPRKSNVVTLSQLLQRPGTPSAPPSSKQWQAC